MKLQDEETSELSVEVPRATGIAGEQAAAAVLSDEPESEAVSVTTLRIDNFRRPFTLNAVKVGLPNTFYNIECVRCYYHRSPGIAGH